MKICMFVQLCNFIRFWLAPVVGSVHEALVELDSLKIYVILSVRDRLLTKLL
jgi:hypothetical protein